MKLLLRICMTAGLAAALLPAAGCVSGQTSVTRITPPEPEQRASDGSRAVANLLVENRGVYLFNWLPVWSGNPYRPNLRKYHLFEDDMHPIHLRFMLEQAARKAGADRYTDEETVVNETGASSLWLLWSRTTRITAVAVEGRGGRNPDE